MTAGLVLPDDASFTSWAAMDADARYMAAALALARRGLGRVAPNPAVGALIVKDGIVVARGWTADGGRPHAETIALQAAGAAAKGATLYVTLEPCSHHGRTPPCADAVIAAGIARVVSAVDDPDPRVGGRGHARLAAAGIEVRSGVLAKEAARLNRGHILRVTKGRPMLTLKLAQTLDGFAAGTPGAPRLAITAATANAFVHMERALNDAILIGSGTARLDDPLLTVRLPGLEGSKPLRIVLDSHLTLDPRSKLAATASDNPTLVVTSEAASQTAADALVKMGIEILRVAADASGQIDLAAAFLHFAKRGLTRIFCEGGPRLAEALLQNDLVDEIILLTGAIPLKGEGIAALNATQRASLNDVMKFHRIDDRMIGADHLQRFERGG